MTSRRILIAYPHAGNGIALEKGYIATGRMCVFTTKPELGKYCPVGSSGGSGSVGRFSTFAGGQPGAANKKGEKQSGSRVSRPGAANEHHGNSQSGCRGIEQRNREEYEVSGRTSDPGECRHECAEEMEIRTRIGREYRTG